MEQLGLYIHIPFCRSKCAYCDFYSLAGAEGEMEGYQKALLAHMKEVAPLARGHRVDTVYIGGGTPSYYGAKRLKEIIKTVKKGFQLEKDAEITVEANPDSVDAKLFTSLRRAGVTRISMGMQSAQGEELQSIGRPHSFTDTQQGVALARKCKIKNLSLDIIYGLPQQTEAGWRETVEAAIALSPEHISCYGLKVEEGTPLYQRVLAGEVLPDDDCQAERYLWTVERLAQGGYHQYEISNFARAGMESRHNLRYWQMRPYIGFGPGAHSDFGHHRYSIVRDLQGYIQGVLEGGRIIDSDELIPPRERSSEYLMLGLRTVEGIEEWEYRRRYHMDFTPIGARLETFQAQGWAEKSQVGRWHLTPRGMLVSNALIADLQECQSQGDLGDKITQARVYFAGQKGGEDAK